MGEPPGTGIAIPKEGEAGSVPGLDVCGAWDARTNMFAGPGAVAPSWVGGAGSCCARLVGLAAMVPACGVERLDGGRDPSLRRDCGTRVRGRASNSSCIAIRLKPASVMLSQSRVVVARLMSGSYAMDLMGNQPRDTSPFCGRTLSSTMPTCSSISPVLRATARRALSAKLRSGYTEMAIW